MSLPGPSTNLTTTIPPADAHAAALYVAGQLGDECRDVLEALGLIGYVGYDHMQGHKRRVWREGACTNKETR